MVMEILLHLLFLKFFRTPILGFPYKFISFGEKSIFSSYKQSNKNLYIIIFFFNYFKCLCVLFYDFPNNFQINDTFKKKKIIMIINKNKEKNSKSIQSIH